MAGGILGTGVSGLAAAQYGLDTTGHNIANVNTDGFSRQRVETQATVGNAFRTTFLGNGTQLAAISRAFNEFNYKEVLFNASQFEYNNTQYTNATRIDNLLADPDTGITATFEEMFDGINGVVEEPTLIASRNVVLARAENTAKRFNTLYEEVAIQHMGAINEEITTSVEEINSITEEIALLNTKIQVENAVGEGGFPPNDLLDTRDRLVRRLSEFTQVNTIDLPDGSINVTIGNGLTLVTGAVSIPMSVERNKYDSSQLEIGISVDKTVVNKAIVTDSLAGGSLSALVDVRDNLILPAIRELGKLATVIADSFNRQQTLGRDLNGVEGTDIFMDVNDPQLALGRTLNSSDNVTPSVFEVYIRNTNELTADEYDMEYVNDGVNPETLNIYDTDGNLIQTFDAADIANMSAGTALPVSGIGISLAIDTNNMTDGDSFKIRPVNNGANKIEKIMTDPSLIAAADNYLEVGDVTNPNNVVASVYRISDVTNTGFPHPNNVPGTLPDESIQIVVDATGTQYDIQDSAGTSLLGGFQDIPTDQIVEGVGLSVKLDGVLAGGEVFTITHADNANNDNKRFGPGDNTNALIMLGFQSSKNVDNGTNSFSESYADLVTMVGVQTKGREISKDSFQTLLSGAEERLAGVQGVNLDEEAANLIQYQQAYSAAARIITVARETFQTLISAAG